MGLDISHDRATLEKPDTHDVWHWLESCQRSDKFDGFNVPLSHFEKYIQTIECPEFVDKVLIIIDGEENEAKTREHFSGGVQFGWDFIVDRKDNQLSRELEAYEKKNGLIG